MHGAKGLEFHQVFLPCLDWQPLRSEDKTPHSSWRRSPAAASHGLALARPYIQEKQSSLYLLLRDVKNQRVVDEARRVFYVAVTRAPELPGSAPADLPAWQAVSEILLTKQGTPASDSRLKTGSPRALTKKNGLP